MLGSGDASGALAEAGRHRTRPMATVALSVRKGDFCEKIDLLLFQEGPRSCNHCLLNRWLLGEIRRKRFVTEMTFAKGLMYRAIFLLRDKFSSLLANVE